jgi:hypothetical protein
MMYDLDSEDYTSGSYNQCWLTEHWYPNELLVLDINYPEHRYIFKDEAIRYVELIAKENDFSDEEKLNYLLDILEQKI